MQLVDLLAIVLLAAACAAFFLGVAALARSDDLVALYWLVVGVVAIRASTQIARPVAKA
jgi:hypothetical protein